MSLHSQTAMNRACELLNTKIKEILVKNKTRDSFITDKKQTIY